MSSPAAAIVGIHEYPDRVTPGRSMLQIKASSAAKALQDAGLAWSDVDGLYDCGEAGGGLGPLAVAEYLGLHPRLVNGTMIGGSSYELLAGQAARDIADGRVRVALITYGSTQRSAPPAYASNTVPTTTMESPWGNTLIGHYALATRRHMHEFGTTHEQLAEIAVVARRHALRNPDAVAGLEALGIKKNGPITVEDVVGARAIADPLGLLDCCLYNDGGGAIVIAHRDLVPDTKQAPAWILGSGLALGYVENDGSIATSAAAGSGADAFAEAGVTPDQVDVAMLYDSFTFTVLTALEDLGFCAKGEGGAYVEGGRLAFDAPGGPALNTDGGGLSSSHPGMRGLFLLIEATRQLRGTSTSQVEGARLAVAHGNGGFLAGRHAAATVLLGN